MKSMRTFITLSSFKRRTRSKTVNPITTNFSSVCPSFSFLRFSNCFLKKKKLNQLYVRICKSNTINKMRIKQRRISFVVYMCHIKRNELLQECRDQFRRYLINYDENSHHKESNVRGFHIMKF